MLGPTPTWIAAPHIDKIELAAKFRDPLRFDRECGCKFIAGGHVFGGLAIERAIALGKTLHLLPVKKCVPVMIVDASSGMGDAWTFAAVRWAVDDVERHYERREDGSICQWPDGRPVMRVDAGNLAKNKHRPIFTFERLHAFEGKFADDVTSGQVVAAVVAEARTFRAKSVHGDQRDQFTLKSAFRQRGYEFHHHNYTAPSKASAAANRAPTLREVDRTSGRSDAPHRAAELRRESSSVRRLFFRRPSRWS